MSITCLSTHDTLEAAERVAATRVDAMDATSEDTDLVVIRTPIGQWAVVDAADVEPVEWHSDIY
jgi:SpoVK/Ycf46/Vps4 family AAA+-type ATPase